jgi:hypothetical protein
LHDLPELDWHVARRKIRDDDAVFLKTVTIVPEWLAYFDPIFALILPQIYPKC